MDFQVLSRKCRPKNFSSVLGQESVVMSLKNSVLKQKISHAYLMTGTRGVGKTSIARIFAKSIRCLNLSQDGDACNECRACQDIEQENSINLYEIDGASNNKVDDIRELNSNIQTLPSFGEKKIIIIDEVHMLSISAFNALLKTLEEPPSHIVFIFATTEPWKIPDTIISRCLRFDLLALSSRQLSQYIIELGDLYDFAFKTDEVAEKIAELGNGSVRDTLSLLDQIILFSGEKLIRLQDVCDCIGIISDSELNKIIRNILVGDIVQFNKSFQEILHKNIHLKHFVEEILNKFYKFIQFKQGVIPCSINYNEETYKLVQHFDLDEMFFIFETLSQDFKWAIDSILPFQTIEIILQKVCLRRDLLNSTENKKNSTVEIKEEISPPLINIELEKLDASLLYSKKKNDQKIIVNNINDIQDQKTTTYYFDDWKNFVNELNRITPGYGLKLEEFYVEQYTLGDDVLKIELMYTSNCDIFADCFKSKNEMSSLVQHLKTFYKCLNAEVNFKLIDSVQANKLTNISNIKKNKRDDLEHEKREKLKENPIILHAKKIFDAKIDKLNIN